jgi:hypothetical protein
MVGICSGVGEGGNHSIVAVGEGAIVTVAVGGGSGVDTERQALNMRRGIRIQNLFMLALPDDNLGSFRSNRDNIYW